MPKYYDADFQNIYHATFPKQPKLDLKSAEEKMLDTRSTFVAWAILFFGVYLAGGAAMLLSLAKLHGGLKILGIAVGFGVIILDTKYLYNSTKTAADLFLHAKETYEKLLEESDRAGGNTNGTDG